MGTEGSLVRARLARGCRCFAVWIDGAVAGYGWLTTSREWIGEVQLEITPRSGEAYIWNCVTVAEHRQKGVFRSLVSGISVAARRSGAERVWIGSIAIRAEKALPALGFRPALHFAGVTVAGLHLLSVRRGRDRALATDACSILGVQPGLVIRGNQRRRH
jgi:acetyltransferase (GNAT) family protein